MGEGPSYAETGLTVTDAIALPTVAGTLAVKEASRATLRAVTSAGSCFDDVDAAIVDLDLQLDATLAAYRDVVAYETLVDGRRWTATGAAPRADEQKDRSHVRLFAACDDRAAHNGRDHGLTEGSHLVQIVPTLVGSTEAIAPAQLQVTVACDGTNGDVQPLPPDPTSSSSSGGASSSGEGASSSGEASSSGSTREDTVTADPAAQPGGDGGCTMHAGAGSANAAALVACAALVLARRRRQRA